MNGIVCQGNTGSEPKKRFSFTMSSAKVIYVESLSVIVLTFSMNKVGGIIY